MATSGSINFSVTANDIITEALELLGVLGEDETPTTGQTTSSQRTLNMMVKSWQANGLNLFAVQNLTIPVVPGQSAYILDGASGDVDERPMNIIEGYYQVTGNPDIPMEIISRLDYNELTTKDTIGIPNQMYYDPQVVGGGILNVWPTGQAGVTANLKLVVQRTLEDFDDLTDNPDYPQEWYMALSYNLAKHLAPKYGTPQMDYSRLMQQARELYQSARDFDTEMYTSMFIRPDTWGNDIP